MNSFSELKSFTDKLDNHGSLMPSLFIGHGSPMNGIEDNEFSKTWSAIANEMPIPRAVIVISAHWLTKGTGITAMEFPKTIHDFGGFPDELYQVQYPAKGSPELAQETKDLVGSTAIELNHDWGLDHGAWTVVRHMYPNADVPILQISIDYSRDIHYHYALAKELSELRKKGVLIIGSGNMVHNLRMIAWNRLSENNFGYDWAFEINQTFKNLILENNHKKLINYPSLGKEALMAIPTPEHFIPLIYNMGLKAGNEEISFFNDKAVGGSITMTSLKIG
jgi:4,5-DOPA dioxygenase extradiol